MSTLIFLVLIATCYSPSTFVSVTSCFILFYFKSFFRPDDFQSFLVGTWKRNLEWREFGGSFGFVRSSNAIIKVLLLAVLCLLVFIWNWLYLDRRARCDCRQQCHWCKTLKVELWTVHERGWAQVRIHHEVNKGPSNRWCVFWVGLHWNSLQRAVHIGYFCCRPELLPEKEHRRRYLSCFGPKQYLQHPYSNFYHSSLMLYLLLVFLPIFKAVSVCVVEGEMGKPAIIQYGNMYRIDPSLYSEGNWTFPTCLSTSLTSMHNFYCFYKICFIKPKFAVRN